MAVVKIELTSFAANAEAKRPLRKGHGGLKLAHIRKADANGEMQDYLAGITSGATKWDAHGQRMSDACIDDFTKQHESGTITLLTVHTDDVAKCDVGVLAFAEKTQEGEWYNEFRLFNQSDKAKGATQDQIDTAQYIKKKATGDNDLFQRPSRFEFSIQGMVNLEEDIEKTDKGEIIHRVALNGVALCWKGAYPQENGASTLSKAGVTIRKAIAETANSEEPEDDSATPAPVAGLYKGIFSEAMQAKQQEREWYEAAWEQDSTLFQQEREILKSTESPERKQALLQELYGEFAQFRIQLFQSYNFSIPGEESETEEEPMSETGAAPAASPAPAGDAAAEKTDGATAEQVLQGLATTINQAFQEALNQLRGGGEQQEGDPGAVANSVSAVELDSSIEKALAKRNIPALSDQAKAEVRQVIKEAMAGIPELATLRDELSVMKQGFAITDEMMRKQSPQGGDAAAPQDSAAHAGAFDRSALKEMLGEVVQDVVKGMQGGQRQSSHRESPYDRIANAVEQRKGGAA